ncbi:TIGR00270 family protein [Candidatus Woesearchaeota archaeon]|nr:TIGR00270 family protein [Candidatus Woesearchaeota archaeon]
MICDMCGSSGSMLKAEVEGAILTVCGKCSRFGTVLGPVRQHEEEKKPLKRAEEPEVMDLIVEDYAGRIKKKREELGLTQQEFAKRINEKESLVHKIESGNFHPDIILAKKLQKALGISLLEEYEEKHEKLGHAKSEGFTLGHFIKIRKKS